MLIRWRRCSRDWDRGLRAPLGFVPARLPDSRSGGAARAPWPGGAFAVYLASPS